LVIIQVLKGYTKEKNIRKLLNFGVFCILIMKLKDPVKIVV